MAIGIKFDLAGNPEPPTIILANRNGNKLGQLDVDAKSIDLSDKLNDASELTFTLNKYIDGEITNLWDKVVDFKLVYCKEWDMWFEIRVELDESTETIKTVFCTQLGQAELSQIMLYNIEINTEKDIERDDYKISILYDENSPKASILNRVLEKAPHYSIAYVDPSIAKIQRSFSFDDISIYDAFQEIAEEIGCLFIFNSNSDKNGNIQRTISVYDLWYECFNCGHRSESEGYFVDDSDIGLIDELGNILTDEFDNRLLYKTSTDVYLIDELGNILTDEFDNCLLYKTATDKGDCQKCGGESIRTCYGEDTLIFVTSDELASNGIQLVTDTDSVKNCFKLEAGDDLMTATVRNCNPNGTDYIWRFSDDIKEDMSAELVERLDSYNEAYKQHYNKYISNVDAKLLNDYNVLVDKYSIYNEELQTIGIPIIGYSSLMNAYYNVIDLALYLESGLMPSVEMSETNAEEQAKLLTSSSLSPVSVANINTVSLATANSTVLAMAKIFVRSTYKVQVNTSELSNDKTTWTGNFTITNYSDEEDTAISEIISVKINGDNETFIKQKIEKTLNKENTDDLSVSGLFEKEYDDFCNELKKYALNPLISFRDACQACIDILIEQGVCNEDATWSDDEEGSDGNLYENLYIPYYNKLMAIEAEIKVREDEINIISGIYDVNGNLITKGLKTNIDECKLEIQNALNFENYLGDELWMEFCSYRREDKYSNENYISDGLNNAELFKRALEFFEVAENEIYKSSEAQCSISATLNNLLAIPKFKPLVKSFKLGNWIRVQIDNKVFKLRLIEYGINFGDFNNISVEFSDVTKVKNGVSDVQSILSQASSMATSYDSTKRQAKQGEDAQGTIEQWLAKGLNSALVQIQNNDSEEITLTKNGLLGRSYDDVTGTYSPEQIKLTHNIMAYTDDNWRSVRLAVGKHEYTVYDKAEKEFIDKIGYGINADFVTAGVVSGSQIIGGDIYSDNYSDINKVGSYLNLRDGTFSFGGGSLRFEGGQLLISSPDVLTTNQVTEINEKYLKTTTIYAENLQVGSANIVGQLTASQINTNGLIAENISAATIEGKSIIGGEIKSANYQSGINGTYLDLDGEYIEIGGGNLTYSDNVLTLGKKDVSSIINLCGDLGSIYYGEQTDYGEALEISSNKNMLLNTENGIIRIGTSYALLDNEKWEDFIMVNRQGISIISECDAHNRRAGINMSTSTSSSIFVYGEKFAPFDDNATSLGESGHSWSEIYATNATIQTSDEREKENIVPLGASPIMMLSFDDELTEQVDIHSELFDRLIPVQYNFINGNGRICYGLVAQQVASVMEDLGIGEDELDLVHHDYWTDENTGEQKDSYGIAYANLIAMLIHEVQKLKIKNNELEEKIS